MNSSDFSITRSIIHDCPALRLPQSLVERYGGVAQLVVLKGASPEVALFIADACNSATHRTPTGNAGHPSLTPANVEYLAKLATGHLVAQTALPMTWPDGKPYPGFPLPIKRNGATEDGSVTQDYRPIAVLEFCHDFFSGDLAKRQAAKRKEDTALAVSDLAKMEGAK